MRNRLKYIGSLAALLSVIVLTNAHLALIQTIAWSSMLVTYSMRSDLVTGISQTFDGDHPCRLCVVVKEATSRQQTQKSLKAYLLPTRLLAIEAKALTHTLYSPPHHGYYDPTPPIYHRDLDPPPIPPPRGIPS